MEDAVFNEQLLMVQGYLPLSLEIFCKNACFYQVLAGVLTLPHNPDF